MPDLRHNCLSVVADDPRVEAMNSRQKTASEKLLKKSFPIFRWVMTLLLVLSLSSCVEKVAGQEVSVKHQETPLPISQVSRQFSETAPPDIIQELSSSLEVYQPQVKILTPLADEVLKDNTVTVRFQVKDLPIFKDPQWQLGPHLHVILDNQPYMAVYDISQPLVLPDLSPGTHTLRVFASRPWHESFKNEGAYAQTTFHLFTKTDDNNPDPNLPLLTYSRPNGSYGAEPIMLDFYLTNAPLHIVSEDNLEDNMSNWRIRCTINGESFIFDRWQSVYLKGFKPGKNWVQMEFLDNQGNAVKNVFNSTIRLINYQPNGKDALSRMVRGELSAEDVRGIVDPNYTVKIPVAEPTPTVTPKVEVPEVPQPKVRKTPVPEIEVPQAKVEPTPVPEIKVPEVPQPKVEKTPVPEIEVPQAKAEPTPVPEIEVPEVIQLKVQKTPVPEIKVPQVKVEPTPVPEIGIPEIIQPKVEPTPVPGELSEKSNPEKTGIS
jgi:hypothetical protein